MEVDDDPLPFFWFYEIPDHDSSFFVGDQVGVSFPSANDADAASIDEKLGGSRSRIVVAAHRTAVGTCAECREQIASLHRGKIAVLGKVVARFADRTDDVRLFASRKFAFDFVRHWDSRLDRPDTMERIVHRRTDEIVHRTVLDDKQFAPFALGEDDSTDQNARIADDKPTWFECQSAFRLFDRRDDHVRIC